MAKISGFADEISPDLTDQVDGLTALDIRWIALRGCFGKNIMDWTPAECDQIKKALDAGGIGVSEIGSPIGKTPIDEPFEKTAAALEHALKLARLFQTPNVRLFSFYPPAKSDKAGWRAAFRPEVLRRIRAMADQAAGQPVTLVLENETDLYGDGPAECLDIFENVRSDKLRMAFDFANFVSRQHIDVYEKAFRPLRPFIAHVHVKDHVPGEKTACLPGRGAGRVKDILAELAKDRYDGFLTLEPHLSKSGQFQGFSGLEKFKLAADALRQLCAEVGLATR